MSYIKKLFLVVLATVCIFIFTACTLYGLGERIITKGNYYMHGFTQSDIQSYSGHFYFERGKVYNLKSGDTLLSKGKYSVKNGIVSFSPYQEYADNKPNDLVIKNEFLFENSADNYLNSLPESNQTVTKLKELAKVGGDITYDVAFSYGEQEYLLITVERQPKKDGKGFDNNSFIYFIACENEIFTITSKNALTKNPDDIWSVSDENGDIIENFFYYNGNIVGTKKEVLILEFYSLK